MEDTSRGGELPPKEPRERAAYMKQWREKNKDRVRENQRRYEEENRDKVRERQRAYYLKNRERVLARQRAYKEADPEGYRQRHADNARKWREENPEKDRLRSRKWRIEKKYGLTIEEYDAILARGCAICGSNEGRVLGKRNGQEPPPPRLCLDHDHTTGKVRDALCHDCNVGLGSFGDDPARLRAAADYLDAHRLT